MNSMKRRGLRFYFKIYFKILAQDIKSKMSYRADFLISTIGMICTNISGFISFWILFRNFPSINGWGYYEMLFLYGFSLVSLTPVQCLFDNNWSLRQYVYSGDFIKYCFRPINLFFYYQSEVFDIKGLGQLAFGIGTIAYSWANMDLPFDVIALLKLIVFLITASLIMISLPIILIQQIQDRWSEFFGDTVSILFKYGIRTFGIGFQQVKRFFNNACIDVHDCYSLQ